MVVDGGLLVVACGLLVVDSGLLVVDGGCFFAIIHLLFFHGLFFFSRHSRGCAFFSAAFMRPLRFVTPI